MPCLSRECCCETNVLWFASMNLQRLDQKETVQTKDQRCLIFVFTSQEKGYSSSMSVKLNTQFSTISHGIAFTSAKLVLTCTSMRHILLLIVWTNFIKDSRDDFKPISGRSSTNALSVCVCGGVMEWEVLDLNCIVQHEPSSHRDLRSRTSIWTASREWSFQICYPSHRQGNQSRARRAFGLVVETFCRLYNLKICPLLRSWLRFTLRFLENLRFRCCSKLGLQILCLLNRHRENLDVLQSVCCWAYSPQLQWNNRWANSLLCH